MIESQASAENNQFTTGSLTAESIANHSEVKVSSAGGGLSTDPTQNIANGFATGLSALGNIHQQDSSTTHSAIGSNIQLTTQQGEIPTTLSRDTATANERVQKADMEEVKARQEMAQVIGDIANNGITLVLKPKLDEAERQKAEAEAILKQDTSNQAAKQQLDAANKVLDTYGLGGKVQLAVRAVTGVLQGIATGDASQAVVGGLSPYINHQIKEATTDKDGNVNLEANLMAHALLGAIEAYATGNNAAAGAAGAVSGELAAKLITEQLYQKSPEQLTEAQKQTVSALSQLASGLAGGLISDSTAGAINSAEIGKRAVENNYLFRHEAERLQEINKQLVNICATDEISCAALRKERADLIQISLEREQKAAHACQSGNQAMCADAKEDVAKAVQSYPDGGAIPSLSGVVVSESMNVKGFRDTLDCIAGKGCVEIPMLVLGGAVGAGLSTTSTGAAALSMGKDIGLLVGKQAVKYPKITEGLIAGTVSTGFDIYNGSISLNDKDSLARIPINYALAGVMAGKSLGKQISIATSYQALISGNESNKSPDELVTDIMIKDASVGVSFGTTQIFPKIGIGGIKGVIGNSLLGSGFENINFIDRSKPEEDKIDVKKHN